MNLLNMSFAGVPMKVIIWALAVFATILVFYHTNGDQSQLRITMRRYFPAGMNYKETVFTAKGLTTFEELEKKLLRPFGYQLIDTSSVIPQLSHINPPSCSKVFNDWLTVAKTYDESKVPPKTLPAHLSEAFLMYGYGGLYDWYRDDRSAASTAMWPKEDVEKKIHDPKIVCPDYGGEGEAVYYATKYYNLAGMTGLVIGSLTPWVEAFCLRNGAEKVITVEYKNITTDHPKLGYYHPIEMAQNWQKYQERFDFAVSFSSLEHSGLGRYGDPMDPIGDLREMQKIWCQLKPGALLFLGLPVGMDRVVYNVHRGYGRIRLGMMLAGWELVNTFNGVKTEPQYLDKNTLHSNGTSSGTPQWLFVARKPYV